MAALVKPQLRNLLVSELKKHCGIAVGFSLVCAFTYRHFMGSSRKAKYAEFYKTYDPQADFMRMREAGVFQSVSKEGKVRKDRDDEGIFPKDLKHDIEQFKGLKQ